jgi:hypothetical protein
MAQMTKPRRARSEARRQLGRLADALAQEALETPDEEFLAEVKAENGRVDEMARAAKDAIARGIAAYNKGKLAARRADYEAKKKSRDAAPRRRFPLTLEQKRQTVARFAAKDPALKSRITMAARGEAEMSESDLDGFLEDLRELGAIDDEGNPT